MVLIDYVRIYNRAPCLPAGRFRGMKSSGSTTSAAKLLDIGCPKVILTDGFLFHSPPDRFLLTIPKSYPCSRFRRRNNPEAIFYL